MKSGCIPATQTQNLDVSFKNIKIYHLLLDCHNACQNVLIRNITLLIFGFIATTLQYVLQKYRCKHDKS